MSLWWLMKYFFTKMHNYQSSEPHIFSTKIHIKNLKDRFWQHVLESISTKFQIPILNRLWDISKNSKLSLFPIKMKFSENHEVFFLKKLLHCKEYPFPVNFINNMWKYYLYFYCSNASKRTPLTFAQLSLTQQNILYIKI